MQKDISLLVALFAAASAEWVPIGPDGGYIQAYGIDLERPDTVYSMIYSPGYMPPVYRTTDHGASWDRLGEIALDPPSSIVVDPFAPEVLLGPTGNNTLQRSTDHGENWRLYDMPFYAVAVAFDPFVPGRVYAAGMYYDTLTLPAFAVSTDHGETWVGRLVKDDTGSIYAIDVSPLDSGTIFLAADYGTVFRSNDAGANWRECTAGLSPDDIILTISASHGDPRVICAGSIYGMFRSTNSGDNWQPIGNAGFIMSVDLSASDPAAGYAYGYDTAMACYYTTDAGLSWHPTAPIQPTSRMGGILADPGLGRGAWCPTTAGMQYTTDYGVTWAGRNSGIRSASIATISAPVWNPGRAYVEVENVGVFKTLDAGQTWQKCADFLSCGSVCGIGVAPPDVLYALEGAG